MNKEKYYDIEDMFNLEQKLYTPGFQKWMWLTKKQLENQGEGEKLFGKITEYLPKVMDIFADVDAQHTIRILKMCLTLAVNNGFENCKQILDECEILEKAEPIQYGKIFVKHGDGLHGEMMALSTLVDSFNYNIEKMIEDCTNNFDKKWAKEIKELIDNQELSIDKITEIADRMLKHRE